MKHFIAGGVIAVLLFGWIHYQGRWSGPKVAASRERGEAIVTALRQFKAEKGTYPARLEELVPQYLDAIEPPLAGDQKWGYTPRDGGRDFDIESKADLI